jgi:hypothetical protein
MLSPGRYWNLVTPVYKAIMFFGRYSDLVPPAYKVIVLSRPLFEPGTPAYKVIVLSPPLFEPGTSCIQDHCVVTAFIRTRHPLHARSLCCHGLYSNPAPPAYKVIVLSRPLFEPGTPCIQGHCVVTAFIRTRYPLYTRSLCCHPAVIRTQYPLNTKQLYGRYSNPLTPGYKAVLLYGRYWDPVPLRTRPLCCVAVIRTRYPLYTRSLCYHCTNLPGEQ